MSHINEMELQNLRHMIGAHDTCVKKLETYAQQCQDQTLKQMLQKDASDAKANKQKLMSFLQ
ncbi:MAG TPA: hypothetical protein VIL89_05295 [Clostridia bacterium]